MDIKDGNYENVSKVANDMMLRLVDNVNISENDVDLIRTYLDSLASDIKDNVHIKKKFVKEIWFLIKLLRQKSAEMTPHRTHLEASCNQIEYLFELILLGETVSDRKPGVPRFL